MIEDPQTAKSTHAGAEGPLRQRITLTPTRPADAPLLARWRSEPSVRRFQPLTEVSRSQLEAELAHNDVERLHRGVGDKFQWIVRVADEPAGWITLVVTNWEHGLAEIGYALSSGFQGRGIMPTALTQLLADLFLGTPIERVEARCTIGNAPSQHVLEALGFRREGTLRQYFRLRGKRVDNYIYAILRSDFLP